MLQIPDFEEDMGARRQGRLKDLGILSEASELKRPLPISESAENVVMAEPDLGSHHVADWGEIVRRASLDLGEEFVGAGERFVPPAERELFTDMRAKAPARGFDLAETQCRCCRLLCEGRRAL